MRPQRRDPTPHALHGRFSECHSHTISANGQKDWFIYARVLTDALMTDRVQRPARAHRPVGVGPAADHGAALGECCGHEVTGIAPDEMRAAGDAVEAAIQ